MKHIFKKGNSGAPTFILLHGTGGSENDLVPFAEFIDSSANIVGLRGNVLENNSITRFFARIEHGVFDMASLNLETNNLNSFLDELASKYNLDRTRFILLGYSNGATMIASLLQKFTNPTMGAILLHPFIPNKDVKPSDLSKVKILITTANNDMICPPHHSEYLLESFKNAYANAEISYGESNHSISQAELNALKEWYRRQIK
jgi:phospholipase/carboxylesterase